MPTRIIREGIITSERVNALSQGAELFYRRLMSVVDDYGRYFSHPSLLRAACYPLQLDRITDKDVAEWTSECSQKSIQLIVLYGSGKYIQCINFRQQTRSPSKFPEPSDNELLIICKSNEYQMRSESESESKAKTVGYSPNSRVLLFYLNEQCGRYYRETATNLGFIEARLKEAGVTLDGCKHMIERQCKKWKGTPMEEYLRPSTLFNREKFDAYYAAKDLPLEQPVNGIKGYIPDAVWDSRTPAEIAEQQKLGLA